ncbi:MAG: ribosome silencing factor [Candidatus Niameybacter stercoravium]|nr:ribosome silencing factor [Candidatus Niameybacter stercoravium]
MHNESILLAQKIYHVLNNKKLDDIQVLDVHEITTLADIFIIVTGSNTRQTKALVDELEDALSEENIEVIQKEGYQTANWILMDYGNVIVHVLYKEDAEFYGLDRLWQDGKTILF